MAKLFAPFAALTGFEEVVRAKEASYVHGEPQYGHDQSLHFNLLLRVLRIMGANERAIAHK